LLINIQLFTICPAGCIARAVHDHKSAIITFGVHPGYTTTAGIIYTIETQKTKTGLEYTELSIIKKNIA
jgi:hypothetical protein